MVARNHIGQHFFVSVADMRWRIRVIDRRGDVESFRHVRDKLADGSLVNMAPGQVLFIQLYWHCWNLESEVLDALTLALTETAAQSLVAS